MFFSVIVPVYKVEDYLRKCLESIISQSFRDIEIILVDDGSPDSSPAICDEYASIDARIKVIHKKNGGLSSARNTGLEVASGDYIVFIDSDDWIDPGCFENMAALLRKNSVDVLMTVKTSVYNDDTFLEVNNFSEYLLGGFDKRRAIEWILNYGKSVGAPNKIIKRNVIEKYNLRFFEGILHEDYDWTFKVCLYANTFDGYDEPWYNYRMIRDGSITNKVSAKSITSVIETTRVYYDLFCENNDWIHERIFHRSMDALYISLNKAKYLNEESIDTVIKSINENIMIFKYAGKTNQWLFMVILRCFGAKFALKILRMI